MFTVGDGKVALLDCQSSLCAIQAKLAFRAVFQVATTWAESGVILIKEPSEPDQQALSPFSWWRRGSEPVSTVPAD